MHDQPAPKVLDSLWRYRWSSLAVVLGVVVLSVAVSLLTADRATAQARIVLKAPDRAGLVGVEAPSESAFVRYVNQRALFAGSDRVLTAAAAKVGDPPVSELREQVTAEASANGDSIVVRVTADDYAASAALAEAVVGAYQDESRADVRAAAQKLVDTLAARRAAILASIPDVPEASRSVEPNYSAAGQSLSELDKQVTQVRAAAEQFGDGVSFVDRAVPDPAAGGAGARNAVLGLALGLLAAAALAWLRADRDRRVRDVDDLAGVVEEPVLAEVETLVPPELAALREVGSPPLWPYQFAAASLRTAVDRGVVVVTTPGRGDGATTATLQMATTAARGGSRVLVVDAAVRSHGLSDLLGLRYDRQGLTSIAVGAARLEDCVRVIDLGDQVPLWVIPAGQYEEATLDHFRSSLLRAAVAAMRAGYDLVLVDSPPPAIAPEVTPLVRESDGVVVVVRRDRETRVVHRLRDQVRLLGGAIIGYLFTFVPPRSETPRRDLPTPLAPLRRAR
ncbi:Chromosome partitioning ATPase, Mrp family, contains Fe-S cluster [Amycolatopsis arida]|uniref:Chromosome partitioning ATPase, Mrp family, contains Fe-S cluster n=1 Tax=Amycolatopsis arida TaxID=587909 RepID=A0A1I5Z7R0_9PSEU|nr:cell shape-determining protein [Amycolatopsis arida]TDX90183.1 Mrp family chromosome partitioning ATPase [Amycolatopsis arida]SFQ52127.1 Chromosome partitioning ATPase, Mrp family, contains Fe-S cluster [Amycolatopsis arida]